MKTIKNALSKIWYMLTIDPTDQWKVKMLERFETYQQIEDNRIREMIREEINKVKT